MILHQLLHNIHMSYISAMLDKKRDLVIVWERDTEGNRIEQLYDAPYYFYQDDPNGKYTTIYDTKVSKLTFESGRDYYAARKQLNEKGVTLWESDISPELRVLSNHYYGIPAPKLHVTYYDIENNFDPDVGYASVRNPYAPINAISMFHSHQNKMVMLAVPPPNDGIPWNNKLLEAACNDILPHSDKHTMEYVVCTDERELLVRFLSEIKDSDLLVGWNSEVFDHPYTAKRIETVLGKTYLQQLSFPGGEAPQYEEVETKYGNQIKLVTSGRLLADYMVLYKKYEFGERPSYKLAAISSDVLVDKDGTPTLPKLEYTGNLSTLYNDDFAYFCRYCQRDTEILMGFEEKLGYVEVANQMYHMSCGQFQHVPGTLKLAELAIVNHCHHTMKRVVNNITAPEEDRQIDGALVLLPQVGMHEWVGSVDINSLYPSAIRSINISPETLRGQFTNNTIDADAISNNTDRVCTLQTEDGDVVTATAGEFRVWLQQHKYAISGYGTVFDQSKQGIIPAVLTDWYAKRKDYQKLYRDTQHKADKILDKYRNAR